uniref:Glutamate rich 5 n=1 Tax=Oryctolagus cuniculus TaxID=9986 RepID=G1TDL4_RABIT
MGCASSALNKAGESSRFRSGETEEQMETEVEYKKASGGAETNEETGEAVDLSAAT